jgi:hypothetical protein
MPASNGAESENAESICRKRFITRRQAVTNWHGDDSSKDDNGEIVMKPYNNGTLNLGANLGAIQEVQKMVESGRHLIWNKAVNLLSDKTLTPLMKLRVEEAFLVVAFSHGNGNWGLVTSSITKENPLQDIAAIYQTETIFGGINSDGTCFFLKNTDTPAIAPTPGCASYLSAFPIGLVLIGRNRDGVWADEFIGAHVEEMAALLGRSLEEEKRLLRGFTFEAAEIRIAELIARLQAN